MDKKQMFAILVAIFFIVGMFTYLSSEEAKRNSRQDLNASNTTGKFSAAEGTAIGRLASYEKILFIFPWNESYKEIIESLKVEKQIEYMNIVGENAVVTLANKANISYIREKMEDTGADVFAVANIVFDDPINFTLLNGSSKVMSIGSVSKRLDPSTPIGERFEISITADISDADIKVNEVTLKPKINIVEQELELECGPDYFFEGNLEWSKRDINVSDYARLLNVSEDRVHYKKEDFVLLSRILNSSEMEALRNRNLSFLTYILSDRIYTNTLSKTEVESALSHLGVGLSYPDSYINATFSVGPEQLQEIISWLNSTVDAANMTRNCNTTLSKIMINGSKYYAQSNSRYIEHYIDINKAAKGTINASLKVYCIGRTIVFIEILEIK
ncbi:MAG: hypothetical protein QW112_03730 [Candidatus Micrarchaeia archaeon]